MKGRHHYPHSATGKDTRAQGEAKAPAGVRASWPAKGTQNATGKYRRKARPLHPDCATDKTPHRALVSQWRRDKVDASFIRTKLAQGDALERRAATVYRKHMEALGQW